MYFTKYKMLCFLCFIEYKMRINHLFFILCESPEIRSHSDGAIYLIAKWQSIGIIKKYFNLRTGRARYLLFVIKL